jgi:hypothetical protein
MQSGVNNNKGFTILETEVHLVGFYSIYEWWCTEPWMWRHHWSLSWDRTAQSILTDRTPFQTDINIILYTPRFLKCYLSLMFSYQYFVHLPWMPSLHLAYTGMDGLHADRATEL